MCFDSPVYIGKWFKCHLGTMYLRGPLPQWCILKREHSHTLLFQENDKVLVHQQENDSLLLSFSGSAIYHEECCLIPGTQRQAQGVTVKIQQKNGGRFCV